MITSSLADAVLSLAITTRRDRLTELPSRLKNVVVLLVGARNSLKTVFEKIRFSATSPPKKLPSRLAVLTSPPPL